MILGLLFNLCAQAAVDTPNPDRETARLNTWLDARYEEELQLSPMQLTWLGRGDRYDQIDDYSRASELARYQLLERSAAELQQSFDYEQLGAEGKISYDYWLYRLQAANQALPYLNHRYQFTTEGGAHSELPDFLINAHAVDTRQDMLAYIARISEAARALRQALERAQLAAAQGIRPPRFAYAGVIEVAGKIISGAPFTPDNADASPLWTDASQKIDKLLARGLINQQTANTLAAQTAQALQTSLLPAYRDLIRWLQADMANTTTTAQGVSALPDGAGYYRYCLADYTTTGLSATAIYALGIAEVARTRGEIRQLMKKVGFAGSLEDFFHLVRTDPRFYFSNDDTGREAYLALSRRYIREMEARLPAYFGILPQGALVVKRVEPFREQDGMAPFYIHGTADGARPGTYYLHLSDMSALNITDLETTAYHEAIPGHHMETSIAQEQSALPAFRNDLWYSAYSEGWALYAEYLAREMGAFADPYSDFGRLAGELLRAVRLVVDTGLHDREWSEQQAVDYMLANTALPKVAVISEVHRYLSDPGQATSYKIGMVKLLALREHARAELGERFDIRRFHDAVLSGGSLPLPILERRVNDWITRQAAATTH